MIEKRIKNENTKKGLVRWNRQNVIIGNFRTKRTWEHRGTHKTEKSEE